MNVGIVVAMLALQAGPFVGTVKMRTPVYSQAEDMSRTIEGLCRSRPFRVHRDAGSPTISVTIDDAPQQFDNPDGITAAIRSGPIGLADFYCTGDTFYVIILQLGGSPMRASGTIQPRTSRPSRRTPK